MTSKIIYEPHPVTPERKQELREKGYKIIDAEFAPAGYEYPESEKKADAEASDEDLSNPDKLKKMTKPKLEEILKARGVAFETDANKDALIKLIVGA